jgi:hypothetical protein
VVIGRFRKRWDHHARLHPSHLASSDKSPLMPYPDHALLS